MDKVLLFCRHGGKKMKRGMIMMVCLPLLLSLGGCKSEEKEKPFVFEKWNECESLNSLQEYVEDVTDEKSEHFIPKEDRIATFDMDGTFYGELFPTYLEYSLLQYRGLEDETYEAPDDVVEAATAIKNKVENGDPLPSGFELIHANAAAKAYAGMTLDEFDAYVKEYLKKPVWGFDNLTYGEAFYHPMLEVFDYLRENDFDFYVVSGSDRFICRSLVCDALGIPENRVIGMDVELKAANQGDEDPLNYLYNNGEDLLRTDHLLIKNLKMNKVKQIAQEIGKKPVLSFGNSSGDCSMHNYALSNTEYRSSAFMLIADDFERDYSSAEHLGNLPERWEQAGYHIISMKDDFKTIYPEKATRHQNA